MRTATLLVLAAAVGLAAAECPNMCSGHGDCGSSDACTCWNNFMGADCSLRVCPYDNAWADVAQYDNVAHNYAECSDAGICDRESGECVCREGYTGIACQRTTCMNDCSGHGVCESLHDAAHDLFPTVAGNTSRYYRGWDAHKIRRCRCDGGWEGVDCSMRSCPRGDDPLTIGQNDVVNSIAIHGRPYGEASFVYVASDGTTWATRPLRIARYVSSEAVTFTVDCSDAATTCAADNGGTTSAISSATGGVPADMVPGDLLTIGGDSHIITAVTDYADPATFDVFPAISGAKADAAVTRAFGGAAASEVQAALKGLPDRVLDDVSVSLDTSVVDGAIANVDEPDAGHAVVYRVTFSSPSSAAYPIQIDFCACTGVGCQPLKDGISYDTGSGGDVFVIQGDYADGANSAAATVAVSGTNTAAEWDTAFGSKCNTLFDDVPTGYYVVTADTGACTKQRGLFGTPERVECAASTDFNLYDGIVFQTDDVTTAGAYHVFAPMGYESVFTQTGKEDAVCSDRGLCNYETGQCDCFQGHSGVACETQTILV